MKIPSRSVAECRSIFYALLEILDLMFTEHFGSTVLAI